MFRRKAAPEGATPAAPPAGRSGEPFAFEVEDVFTITGRGMVATGRVTRGRIAKDDEISFRSPSGEVIRRRIVAIETLGKMVESANEGDTVGLLFTKPVPFDVLVRGVVFERA
jgi:elongation factor Tu